MLLTEEPTNGLGHHSCGLCPTFFQEVVPTRDADGNIVINPETNEPYLENDQTVSGAELFQHYDDQHADDSDTD